MVHRRAAGRISGGGGVARAGGVLVQGDRGGDSGPSGHGDVAAGPRASPSDGMLVGTCLEGTGMTCDAVREMIHPLLDEELDAGRRADVEFHLQSCVGCAEEHHKMVELRREICSEAPHFKAPERLRARVRKALRAEERRRVPWTWVAAAAALPFAPALVWGIWLLRRRCPDKGLLPREIVSRLL